MRIAVITMVQNEAEFLPLWLAHYSAQFGPQNLFIVDHGSDDRSTEKVGVSCMTLPRTTLDENDRASAISDLHACLLKYYDAVIYTDVDELLIADPHRFTGLIDLFQKCGAPIVGAIGLNVLQIRDRENAIDFGKPLLTQRDWVRFDPNYCKLAYSSTPIRWKVGFHSAEQKGAYHNGLYLLHIRSVDFDIFTKRHLRRNTVTLSEASRRLHFSNHFGFDLDRAISLYFGDDANSVRQDDQGNFDFVPPLKRFIADSTKYTGRDWPTARIPETFRNLIPAVEGSVR